MGEELRRMSQEVYDLRVAISCVVAFNVEIIINIWRQQLRFFRFLYSSIIIDDENEERCCTDKNKGWFNEINE